MKPALIMQADTDTMIRDVTRWKKFMQKHFTQNLLWYVRRLPVGHMHLHLH
jgi:hypothetical protein